MWDVGEGGRHGCRPNDRLAMVAGVCETDACTEDGESMSTHVMQHKGCANIEIEMERLKAALLVAGCVRQVALLYWIALKTTFKAFVGIRWRRRIETMLRSQCPSCGKEREQRCMVELSSLVLKGRDTFTLALGIVERLPGCRVLVVINRRLVEPWNELAETLAVSTDPEINELAAKIANAI
jgi:hypothetical protein